MLNDKKVTAVMPCLNEERTLGTCIEKAQACFRQLGVDGEVVVADNGSNDHSVEVAPGLGAKVVIQHQVKGYGAAIMAGVEAAEGEYLVVADADDSYDWREMGPFIEALDQGNDLVMGNRFTGGIMPGAMPFWHRYLGNPVLLFLARTLYRVPVGDFHCGMRAFNRSAWNTMQLKTPGMEFATEMVVAAAQRRLKIGEIPVTLYPDRRDGPSHLRSFRDGWRHLRFIMTYAPDHLYLIPGLLFFILGVMIQVLLVRGPVHLFGQYFGIHFLALGSLITLIGIFILNLWVLARAITARQVAPPVSSLIAWLKRRFTLEVGLLTGLGLVVFGGGVDIFLLWRWLTTGGAMEMSAHLAFVATTIIAIGINAIFGSFLLNMLFAE